jgi:hypothetical protein
MVEQLNLTLETLRTFWLGFIAFIPQLISALVILIVGWIIARILRKVAIKLLKLVRVDIVAEKAGIEDFLIRGGVKYTTVTIVANLVYWFIMFAVILAALNSIGLQAAAELFNRIIFYIPNVIVAILVLMFGALFAKFVYGVSLTYLSNIGISGADVVSHIAQWAILIFVASVALEQLSIGGQVLVSAFQIAFGAICLALALAFGLGGREWAAHVLEKWWKR